MKRTGWIALTLMIGGAVLANVLTTHFGFVPVGFGLLVTAGTYAAGVTLVARDIVHESGGPKWVLLAILLGTLVSLVLADPAIAIASAVAFLIAELADMLVYTPLRTRAWSWAVILSSIAGAILDTVIFLGLAFGLAAVTGEALTGQLIGKVLWVAVPVALIGRVIRSRVLS